MKKVFKGWLFNRMEKLGGKVFNHVGCKGDDEQFIDFLTHFVPELGTRRRVTFTVESQSELEKDEDYKTPIDYETVENDKS